MKLKIEVTFPKELKNEPLICNLCKQFDIILSIIEASFSTDIGWAILVLQGEENELKKVSDYLLNKGASIKNIDARPTQSH